DRRSPRLCSEFGAHRPFLSAELFLRTQTGPPMRFSSRVLLLSSLLLSSACSGGTSDGENDFEVRTAPGSLDPSLVPLLTNVWMVYARSEALESGGTDLNGDGDMDDQVAGVVRLGKNTFFDLAVASTSFAGLRDEIYLVVDEDLDSTDWDMDGMMDDIVLVHWSSVAGVTTYVDTLDSSDDLILSVGNRAYYTADADASTGDESNLRYVTRGDPLTPVEVMNTGGAGPIKVELLGEDQGMLFMTTDETEDLVDRNGDMDTLDQSTLALLDVLNSDMRIVEVGVALEDDDAPFAAHFENNNDWVVGFLVDETGQGSQNFNPAILNGEVVVPDSCVGTPDTDTTDQVLFWLRFKDFAIGMDGVHNSGVAGADRVLAVDDYVATLSPESDSSCNYNEDADSTDTVVRWIEALDGSTPPRDPSQLHAVATGLPGGSSGVACLEDRFVSVVSELADSDDLDGGKAANNILVAWLDPSAGASTTWTFRHESGNPNFGTGLAGEPYAGATWMAAEEDEGRLPVAFKESVPARNLNNFSLNCDVLTKDSDTLDSLPVWMDFESGPTLDFDGVGFALEPSSAGIIVSRGWVFYRVSESADNIDYNGDSDKNDTIVLRNPTLSCLPRVLATGHAQDTVAVFTDDEQGAAFLTSEFAANEDLNDDGDMNDSVLRHFTF
ncbi:MAG: hypothetical protein ACI82F_001113, partial [Planctomycetota bacterium]